MPQQAFERRDDGRLCDVVMKGGITSGIVYPKAIVELARKFNFKNIGGTSAGAIAAAGAAAAEAGWARGDGGAGFEALDSMSGWFGKKTSAGSNLMALFQPQRSTRRIFRTLLAPVQAGGGVTRMVLATLVALVRNYPVTALLGALPGILGIVAALLGSSGVWLVVLLIVSAVLLLVGAILGAAAAFLYRAVTVPPQNWFGLCSGGSWETGLSFPADQDPLDPAKPPKPLAEWLADLLDRVSGQSGERPLTFGDLWDAGRPAPPDEQPTARRERLLALDPRDRVIDLRVMTTNLSFGTPYRLPFEWSTWPEKTESAYYFDPEELGRIFPAKVVAWMSRDDVSPPAPNHPSLRRLPDAPDLPVVVAARLSLSFPYLLSALRLYSYDGVVDDYVTNWFSDGGISSNFPIHFFDSPLPRWPTVGINLRGPRRRKLQTADDDYVWLLQNYDEGIEELWHDVPGLLGFLGSIKDAMENWRDNLQQRMPGSRDRIAHIAFDKGEGGLNLSMGEDVIARLAERGTRAGNQLGTRFADAPITAPISFDSHRWVRFRTASTALERMFTSVRRGFDPPMPPRPGYAELLERALTAPPAYAPWLRPEQQAIAGTGIEELRKVLDAWAAAPGLSEGSPQPPPVLRMTPET